MVTIYSVLGATIGWHFILVRSCPVSSSHPLFLHLRLETFYLTYWSAVVSGSGCCLGDFCLKKPAETLSVLFVAFMMYFVRPISGLHVFRMRNHSEGTDYRNILGLPQHLTAGRMALWPVLLFMFSAGDLAGLLRGLTFAYYAHAVENTYKYFRRLVIKLCGMKSAFGHKCRSLGCLVFRSKLESTPVRQDLGDSFIPCLQLELFGTTQGLASSIINLQSPLLPVQE